MRTILLLFILVVASWSATVTVCSSGCGTASLQAALDSLANCGDTIQIKSSEPQVGSYTFTNRGCTTANPITVTSDRAAWLPLVGTRITPSHLANMAIISTNASGTINLAGILDGSNLPANNWNFVGIAFNTTGTINYYLVQTKSQTYTAANASQLPHDITFDRCYFSMPVPNIAGSALNHGLWIDGANMTVKNSFFGDIADFSGGFESHPIFILNSPGPLTVQNNYITTSSTTLFAGGDAFPDIPGSVPHNATYQYNYSLLPWKWIQDPKQPYYADFLANDSINPCKKNHGEFKFGDTITWQYNVAENMVNASYACQGQGYAYAMTTRNKGESSFYGNGLGQINFSDSTHGAWTGTLTILANPAGNDGAACMNLGAGIGMECHPIASINIPAKTLVLSTPLSSFSSAMDWVYTYEGSGYIANVVMQHNVFKNMGLGTDNLGTTPGTGVGNAGKLLNIDISQNLFWNPSPYASTIANSYTHLSAADMGWTYSPSNFSHTHNTMLSGSVLNGYLDLHAAGYTTGIQPKWSQWNWSNNIAGPSSTYGIIGDNTTGNFDLTFSTYMANSKFQNNGAPGVSTNACTGSNICSGNIATAWVDPFAGADVAVLKVKAGTIYSQAGTDRNDLGANYDRLPLITGVLTTAARHTATLEFDLAAPIDDAAATQPCVLEVSVSRNLHSDLNTYSVVNDLNPVFFQQPDTSARTNPKLQPVLIVNRHVTWPIGQEATVIGDDGVSHDLRLLAGRVHYGRLMCYGDTEWFSFATTTPVTTSVGYPVNAILRAGAPSGSTIVRVSYGATPALGSSVDYAPGADISIPLNQDALTYYQLQYLTGSTVTYTGPVQTLLGGQ